MAVTTESELKGKASRKIIGFADGIFQLHSEPAHIRMLHQENLATIQKRRQRVITTGDVTCITGEESL